ncbi:hypothetical protein IWZ01DRAFT_318193 [Phyllosticta capitalensis]
MSLSTRPYSICFMPGYPIRYHDGLPQLPLRKILFTHPASSSAFNMGYSGRAKSKRRRFVPPEIWLQVIKCSMPSMISVSKMGKNGQNTGPDGFHLFLFFSELPHIMNLAQVSKTWYIEVKEAFYAQPLWSFDTIHCALSNFLSVRGRKEARFVDYDAAISRNRHVHIGALRMPCYTGERSPAQAVQVSSAPNSPDYQQLHRLFLLENLKHVYIDVGSSGFQEMGQKFKPDTAASLDTALSGASDLIARFGQRFARVLSFHELVITKRPAQKTDQNLQMNREMIHNIQEDGFGKSALKRDQFHAVVSTRISAVLSTSDLASSRSKDAEFLAWRHRHLVRLRVSVKIPKGHIKLRVKRLDKDGWKSTASAPEPVVPFGFWQGSRPPRRAKSDAISKMSDLSRKRPRLV